MMSHPLFNLDVPFSPPYLFQHSSGLKRCLFSRQLEPWPWMLLHHDTCTKILCLYYYNCPCKCQYLTFSRCHTVSIFHSLWHGWYTIRLELKLRTLSAWALEVVKVFFFFYHPRLWFSRRLSVADVGADPRHTLATLLVVFMACLSPANMLANIPLGFRIRKPQQSRSSSSRFLSTGCMLSDTHTHICIYKFMCPVCVAGH